MISGVTLDALKSGLGTKNTVEVESSAGQADTNVSVSMAEYRSQGTIPRMGNASQIIGDNVRDKMSPRKIAVARNMHLDRVFPININYKNSSEVNEPG